MEPTSTEVTDFNVDGDDNFLSLFPTLKVVTIKFAWELHFTTRVFSQIYEILTDFE